MKKQIEVMKFELYWWLLNMLMVSPLHYEELRYIHTVGEARNESVVDCFYDLNAAVAEIVLMIAESLDRSLEQNLRLIVDDKPFAEISISGRMAGDDIEHISTHYRMDEDAYEVCAELMQHTSIHQFCVEEDAYTYGNDVVDSTGEEVPFDVHEW